MPGKALIYCCIAIFIVSSCGITKKHDAQEFCNRISGINDTLDNLTSDWHALFDKALIHKNFSTLFNDRVALGSYISKSRAEIANMIPNSETSKILVDEDSLLSMQATMVSDVYPNFEPLTDLTPKETIDKNVRLLLDDLGTEKAANMQIKKLLQAYGAKYNVKIK